MLNGIDVYEGDGAVEWHKVADAGNQFVFIRGAYGTRADKAASSNAAAARAEGMKVGLYHFFRVRKDPGEQIDAFLAAMTRANSGAGDLPPVLDVEDNPHYDGPWQEADNAGYVDALHQWIDRIGQAIGATPIIYTRASFWSQIGSPAGFAACPLWVASYRKDAPRMPAGWADYTFWQYSDAGSTPGVVGNVDVNRFNGDAAALDRLLV